jgi:hypothetical protein
MHPHPSLMFFALRKAGREIGIADHFPAKSSRLLLVAFEIFDCLPRPLRQRGDFRMALRASGSAPSVDSFG